MILSSSVFESLEQWDNGILVLWFCRWESPARDWANQSLCWKVVSFHCLLGWVKPCLCHQNPDHQHVHESEACIQTFQKCLKMLSRTWVTNNWLIHNFHIIRAEQLPSCMLLKDPYLPNSYFIEFDKALRLQAITKSRRKGHVDGSEIRDQLTSWGKGSLSHCLQGF